MSGRQAVLCPECAGARVVPNTDPTNTAVVVYTQCDTCKGWGYVALIVDHLEVFNPFLGKSDETIQVVGEGDLVEPTE